LDAYTANDTDIFVGREVEEKKLFQQLRNTTLNLLYGMSGTGKTSLAQCGLAKFYDGADWHPFYIRRGNNINESLLKALKDTLIDIEDAAILKDSKLPELVYQVFITFSRPVYLIFDQFEELFTIASNNKEERESFLKLFKSYRNKTFLVKSSSLFGKSF
jgi:AAA+ ATPase superfamily predicted ATPase